MWAIMLNKQCGQQKKKHRAHQLYPGPKLDLNQLLLLKAVIGPLGESNPLLLELFSSQHLFIQQNNSNCCYICGVDYHQLEQYFQLFILQFSNLHTEMPFTTQSKQMLSCSHSYLISFGPFGSLLSSRSCVSLKMYSLCKWKHRKTVCAGICRVCESMKELCVRNSHVLRLTGCPGAPDLPRSPSTPIWPLNVTTGCYPKSALNIKMRKCNMRWWYLLYILGLLVPLSLPCHLDVPEKTENIWMKWKLFDFSDRVGEHNRQTKKSKSSVTYYVTWRTWWTLYFPIIPLFALQTTIQICENVDVLCQSTMSELKFRGRVGDPRCS